MLFAWPEIRHNSNLFAKLFLKQKKWFELHVDHRPLKVVSGVGSSINRSFSHLFIQSQWCKNIFPNFWMRYTFSKSSSSSFSIRRARNSFDAGLKHEYFIIFHYSIIASGKGERCTGRMNAVRGSALFHQSPAHPASLQKCAAQGVSIFQPT